MPKVYCAGPLFNPKEKEEMLEIATALEKEGFDTFLPQRDGLELNVLVHKLLSDGFDTETANQILSRAIFALDVYQVIQGCEGMFVNLNGRVPDEGAVSEAAIAWSIGKPMIAYKTDMRTVFGGGDNPLVSGLFDFELYGDIHEAVESLTCKLSSNNNKKSLSINDTLLNSLQLGRNIWNSIQNQDAMEHITSILKETA